MDPLREAARRVLPIFKEIRGGLRSQPAMSGETLQLLRRAVLVDTEARPGGPPGHSGAGLSEPFRQAAAAPVNPTSPSVIKDRNDWTLETLRVAALACCECPHLVASRKRVVFGVGNPDADLMLIGEAPGADEDAQGEPFVGAAGRLQMKILEAMNLSRDQVYIANILKCRPDMPPGETGNRKPKSGEMAACIPWLQKQIELVNPKVIVALGLTAAEGLLDEKGPLHRLRGGWHDYHGVPVRITCHPSFLLRNKGNAEKRIAWQDMLAVMEKLGMPISEKQRNYFREA